MANSSAAQNFPYVFSDLGKNELNISQKIQHDHCLLTYDIYMGMTKTDSQLVSIIPTNPVGQQVKSYTKYSSFYATSVAVNANDSTVNNEQ